MWIHTHIYDDDDVYLHSHRSNPRVSVERAIVQQMNAKARRAALLAECEVGRESTQFNNPPHPKWLLLLLGSFTSGFNVQVAPIRKALYIWFYCF